MYCFDQFTACANSCVNLAISFASDLGHTYIGSEHLLYGLVAEKNSTSSCLLIKQNISKGLISSTLISKIGKGNKTKLNSKDITPKLISIIDNANFEKKLLGASMIGSEHLLLSLLKQKECYALKILSDNGIIPMVFYNECLINITKAGVSPNTSNSINKNNTFLEKYGVNLTAHASEGKISPCFARDDEINRIVQILLRKTKNNPCIIGEPGVGKTAIVEGLAYLISHNQVPQELATKQIYMLDISSLVAGAKYRGDFEDRIKNVIKEASNNKNVIVFIDEIHTIIGAGAAEGAIDAANILKPSLARGDILVIGATTISEYNKHIQKDSALERRFAPVIINEPSAQTTIEILKKIATKYEEYHNIVIPEKLLTLIVELSDKYITNRFFPDKAIDVLDEACVVSKLMSNSIQLSMSEIEKQLNSYCDDKINALKNQDFERASKIRLLEKDLEKEKDLIINKSSYNDKIILNSDVIKKVVSNLCGVMISDVNSHEKDSLGRLRENLSKKVIGQDDAISTVCNAVIKGRLGLKNHKRPIGVFLFVGPTGVGKTELCKQLSSHLYSSNSSLIKLDMSEYSEKHSVSKLIGAPAGYIGFEEGGTLENALKLSPNAIILFDEIEKAHSDIYNILLQIFEDGTLTQSDGKVLNFKNCIIIMTSNIGVSSKKNATGFGQVEENQSNDIIKTIKTYFKAEFINRIDEIVIFNKLKKEHLVQITRLLIEELKANLKQNNVNLTIDELCINEIANKSNCEEYGAREIRRFISKNIEDLVCDFLMANQTNDINITYDNAFKILEKGA
jgi:ATP-dependent Clp protease ATP-binding subunit ClpC